MSIQSSELITNDDGSIFHLHLLPEDLADTVILVGDPGRVVTGNSIPSPERIKTAVYRYYRPVSDQIISTL